MISIDAMNCATSDAVAREQVTAPDKNGVLPAVSSAAHRLRAHLGESMASIQRLTTPYTNVTTASLQAFHASPLDSRRPWVKRNFVGLIRCPRVMSGDRPKPLLVSVKLELSSRHSHMRTWLPRTADPRRFPLLLQPESRSPGRRGQ